MKALLITLILGFFFQTVHAQTVSIDDAKITEELSISKKKSMDENIDLVHFTLGQLSDSIASNLKKDDLLRKNYSDLSLILILKIDETGKIHSYDVDESNSNIMSNIVLEVINKVNMIKLENLDVKGMTSLKIPIHYTN